MNVLIYHKDCFDGFMCAYLWEKYNRKNNWPFACIPLDYGETLNQFSTRYLTEGHGFGWEPLNKCRVVMCDVTFPTRQEHIDMHGMCASFKVIDHHKTAKEKLAGLDFTTFDMNYSGCQLLLAYELLSIKSQLSVGEASMIEWIADRDLWKFELSNTKAFTAGLASYPMTYESWLDVSYKLDKVIGEGSAILRYQEQVQERHIKAARIELTYKFLGEDLGHEHTIAYLNTTTLHSELGNKLCDRFNADFSCCWSYDEKKSQLRFSLRSLQEGDCDVSAIAKKFPGGGGHKNAAGFTIGINEALGAMAFRL